MNRETGYGTLLAEGHFPDARAVQMLMSNLHELEIGRFVSIYQVTNNDNGSGGQVQIVTNGLQNAEVTKWLFLMSLKDGMLHRLGWSNYLTAQET